MDKRQLYENIMSNIAKLVKKVLNERIYDNIEKHNFYPYILNTLIKDIKAILDKNNYKYDMYLPSDTMGYNGKLTNLIKDRISFYIVPNFRKDKSLYNLDLETLKDLSMLFKNYNYDNSGITLIDFDGGPCSWNIDISYIGAQLDESDVPNYVYHICDKSDLDSILTHGILCKLGHFNANDFDTIAGDFDFKKTFLSLIRPYKGVFVFANIPTAIRAYQQMYDNDNRWNEPIILKINAKLYNWYEDNVMDDFLENTRYKKRYVQSLVTFTDIDPNDIEIYK